MSAPPLLELDRLSVALPRSGERPFALKDVSLTLNANEILCIVGESGSGKSMTASAIMRLLPPGVSIAGGDIRLKGQSLPALSEAAMRDLRGAGIAMIFQEPMTSLNPLKTIGDQIAEVFRIHTKLARAEIGPRVLSLLEEVRIPDPPGAARAYPHEVSGGQRQRAMIAMALALDPAVLIADEPTTALDVTTQAQILKLIRDLQRRKGTGVLFITHDFGVVAEIADRIVVMNQGEVVETGPTAGILTAPQQPYTRKLIAAVPSLTPPARAPVTTEPILSIETVTKTYSTGGLLGRHKRVTHALKDVSLTLRRGETLGVVGESGSGKSTLARCIVGLLPLDAGRIALDGKTISGLSARERRRESPHVQMVFQDPFASLNPRRQAGEIIAQGLIEHGMSAAAATARARELLGLVGLPESAMRRFPHEFSGGQRQRIGLARALALEPKVLVADEPVSALDVSVQQQVLELLADLRERLHLSMVFITHDLRVAAQVCDRVAVMKSGEVVEQGFVGELFRNPQHPYTRELLGAIPGRIRFGAEPGA